MKIIITFLVLTSSIFSQTVSTKGEDKNLSSTSPNLQVRREILDKYFCEISPLLNVRLIYKNFGEKNILLYKFLSESRDEYVVIDKNGKEYKTASYSDNLLYNFSDNKTDNKKRGSRSKTSINKNFVILAPGESYEIDNLYTSIPFQISGGKYTVKSQYLFSSISGIKKSMPDEWESFGSLWTEDITAEPLQFVFEREGKNSNGKCAEIKLKSESGCQVFLSGERKCEILVKR